MLNKCRNIDYTYYREIGGTAMTIIHNDYFALESKGDKVLIQVVQSGFSLKQFDMILRSHPRIKLTNFSSLKNALEQANEQWIEIGLWLPTIEVDIARDKMSATVTVYETLDVIMREEDTLQTQIAEALRQSNVVFGIKPVPAAMIVPGKAVLVARGAEPIDGEDAKITYLPKPERKPVIKADGKADYYEMNFITEIREGSWLGEKILATDGTAGTNVLGQAIPAKKGRDFPIRYDKKSSYEEEEQGKIVIRSKISGILTDDKGMIKVSHHLPIAGDVGVETGNLQFDGTITIRGTVAAGFRVIAKGDISIEGANGVSGAELIKSLEGDIYIRGGIFGLGKTKVEAGGSIFVKHVNEAQLEAGEAINIGVYAVGSNLRAHTIMVDERKGKLMGGEAIAKSSITTAISGNHLERRTNLIIDSVNKQEVYSEIQQRAQAFKDNQQRITELEGMLAKLAQVAQLDSKQQVLRQQLQEQHVALLDTLMREDFEIKEMMEKVRQSGKEEILVTKQAHPGTYIQIGKKSSLFTKERKGRFKLEFGELNV